jgi:hypothetical protein
MLHQLPEFLIKIEVEPIRSWGFGAFTVKDGQMNLFYSNLSSQAAWFSLSFIKFALPIVGLVVKDSE